MIQCRITDIEAEYMMWQLAFAWVSEAASHKTADFYNEMRSAAMLNDDVLDKEGVFYPNDAEVDLIFKAAGKVTEKLFNKMKILKTKYNIMEKGTPQTFVKSKYPNSKNMYREGGGHAIMYYDKEQGKDIVLAYGNTSAKAWKNAKENILTTPSQGVK